MMWANQTQAFFPVVQAKLCSLFFWSNNSHTWAMLTYSSLVLLDLHVAWCHHQGLLGPRFSRVETEASTQLRVMSTVLLTSSFVSSHFSPVQKLKSSREDSTNLYVILLAWKPATSSEKHSITPACKHWGWLLMNVLILLGHSNSRNKELKQI